jgi:alkylation response protein AidB-like acyl-CoA dehydrogenase
MFDFAPVDFEDAMDNYEKVLEIIGDISAMLLLPNAESVDHDGPVLVNNEVIYAKGTKENHEILTKAGLVGMSLPRKYGGLNFSVVPYVMAAEIVSGQMPVSPISGAFRIVRKPFMSLHRMKSRTNIFHYFIRVPLPPWF